MRKLNLRKAHHDDVVDKKMNIIDVSKKFKVSVITAALTTLICTSTLNYAADLEIYKIPEDSVGATTLMMMLDLSGSMGYGDGYSNTSMSIQEDYEVCVGSKSNVSSDTTTTTYYTRYYCPVTASNANTRPKVTGYWSHPEGHVDRKWIPGCEKQADNSYRCFDRLTRLKDGLRYALLGNPPVPKIDGKIILGLSTFAGTNGYIRIPARALGEVLSTYTVQVPYEELVEKTREVPYIVDVPYSYKKTLWRIYSNKSGNSTKIYYRTCDQWNGTDNKDCSRWDPKTTKTGSPYEPSRFNTSVFIQNCSEGNQNDCKEYGEKIDTTKQETRYRTESYTETVTKYKDEVRNTTQRDLLLSTLKDLKANNGTPTPYAYAEAAAYLLGTTTVTNMPTNLKVYFGMEDGRVNNSKRNYAKCSSNVWSITECTSWNYWYNDGVNFTAPSGYTKDSSSSTFNYRSNGQNYSYNGYYYTGPSPENYSGFELSVSDSIKDNKYDAPVSITSQKDNSAKKECSGQGIYFLTDGQPQPGGVITGEDGKSGTAYSLMKTALGSKGNEFSCLSSPLGKRSAYDRVENGWACVGKFAQALLDPEKNPANVKIQTAVVGFGSSFGAGGTETDDVKDAKDWGNVGGGGWISGSSPEDVAKSINDFITTLNKDVPSMSTGSSTIPMDALNPEVIQPFAYSPQFEPKVNPSDRQQLWFGNLKKYYVVNGGIYSSKSGGSAFAVVKKSKLQDLNDDWAKTEVTYGENTPIFKKGGVLSQLLLGLVNDVNDKGEATTNAGRKLLTEYNFDGTADEDEQITRDFDLKQISYDYTTDEETKTDDADRVRSLMALLGINISDSTDTNNLDLSTATAEENLRQMGSIYHSLPVLLTQEGKAVAEKNATTGKVQISLTGRKDYIMFGTTQGLLTVVDASSGKEKFSFVPKEMIEKQAETFKVNAGNLLGGKDALYYGLDGEWTAHTVYVTKNDGTLTVKGASRAILGKTPAENENFDGKQWVYGGMRMGGRSYYSLDLTNIDNPKLKFHIDPSSGKVYSKDNPDGKEFAAIENMAQSWSKPKLEYINWKGQRKLVMFVGGGYDAGGDNGDGLYVNGIRTGYAGYEHYDYAQDNKKGSGVYMFDADNGDLLWYADSADNGEGDDIEHAAHNDLKYSVVSDIKTIDRNNDGLIDHLYFGDLAGQAFRVDFNGTKDSFNSQVNKILDLHQADGTSPRFYMAPVFTAHHSAHKKEGAHIVVASFISGNKSSPLLGTTDSPSTTGKKDTLGLAYDGVYAIYDYDIHPNGKFFPNTNSGARTLAAKDEEASTTKLKYINKVVRNDTEQTLVKGAVADPDSGWGGWYYHFEKKFNGTSEAGPGIIKGLTPMIAMEGSLYVTMYDASNNGTTSSCGAGVKGHSFTQRLCLPTGVCPENANYKYNLGAGIIGLNVGSVDGSNTKSIVVPDPDDICEGENCSPCEGTDCKVGQKFIAAGGSIRFIPNRWFERYARME